MNAVVSLYSPSVVEIIMLKIGAT